MRLIRTPAELQARGRKVCLAIGFFDGVHLGHQQIIRQTISDARQHEGLAVVLTFDRHPNTVVAPSRVPPLIYSATQKQRAIQSLGPDALLEIHFDQPFSRLSGEHFVRWLLEGIGTLHSICVGNNFAFGSHRSGNVQLLRRLGADLGFAVHGLAAVSLDGQPVSSTRIRRAISSGHLDQASQMLGRDYSICGPVVSGDALGRQLGFPTANLDVPGLALPPHGVYAVHARTGSRTLRAVLNVGHRPTLASPAPQLRVEAHLLDFHGDLLGHTIEIFFVAKLREEKKFASLEELKAQIARDIAAARERF